MATQEITRNLSGLARALAQQGLLSDHDAEMLQTQARSSGVSFVEQVLASKRMTALQLAVFASRAFGVPLLDLAAFDVDQINKDYVDTRTAAARRVLPLHRRGNRLFVATSDPANLQALEEVRFKTNLIVESVVVEDDKLGQAIHKLIEASGSTLQELASMDELEVDLVEGGVAASSDEESSEVDDAPVVRYIQKILLDAINAGVSDIHFEPFEKFYRIRYRLDGELMEVAQPPIAIKDKVASRIKIISKLDISEKRVPQDGRMKLVLSKTRAIDFRVSTLPTLFGEKVVVRILDSAAAMIGIDALGYDPQQQAALLHAIHRPYGMVLATGPTGSGKTISLYTCLNLLNQPHVNISTAEDPAEIQMPGVNQVNINEKAGLTFAAALRSFLRQDPDIIMVGEIRDLETAEIAVKAAQTGHLLLSTLHTNDAPSTLIRLAEHGCGAVQHRLVGAADPGAAPRAPAVPEMQGAGGHPARGAAARGLRRVRSRRDVAGVQARRLRRVPEHRIQGPRRHLRGDAGLRRDAPADHAQRLGHGARGPCQGGGHERPAPFRPDEGQGRHHVARGNRGRHQRLTKRQRISEVPSWPPPRPYRAPPSRNTRSSGSASTATAARCAARRARSPRPSSRPTSGARASASPRSSGRRCAAGAASARRTSASSPGSSRRC